MTSERRSILSVGAMFVLFALMLGIPAAGYIGLTSASASAQTVSPNFPLLPPNEVPGAPVTVTCGDPYPAGLCPSLLLKAYDVSSLQSSGVTGTGQTVVIDDACGSPTIASDLATFDSYFGLPNPTLNVIDPQGTPCTNTSWGLETSLDVEWSHVMAPGATIDLLQAASPSAGDLTAAWSYSLSHTLGNQISNSWGGSSLCGTNANSILDTAKSDHVTVLASAGDSLAWGQGTTQTAQSPADCKDILTVGGTQLNISKSGAYVSESVWGSSCVSKAGTGGGYVPGTPEPSYQTTAGITDSFGLLGKPDVSAVADPCTGVWVYDSSYSSTGWLVLGGTSVSCPLWAGFMADVNQIRASNGFNAAGLVNPYLYTHVYGAGGSSALYSKDFHDITTGTNGWPAGPGWDAATGLGSFIADPLAHTLGNAPTA